MGHSRTLTFAHRDVLTGEALQDSTEIIAALEKRFPTFPVQPATPKQVSHGVVMRSSWIMFACIFA